MALFQTPADSAFFVVSFPREELYLVQLFCQFRLDWRYGSSPLVIYFYTCLLQGGPCDHGLSFVYNLAKYSAEWWTDTVAALLPSWDTGMSYFIVNKRQSAATWPPCTLFWTKLCKICFLGGANTPKTARDRNLRGHVKSACTVHGCTEPFWLERRFIVSLLATIGSRTRGTTVDLVITGGHYRNSYA